MSLLYLKAEQVLLHRVRHVGTSMFLQYLMTDKPNTGSIEGLFTLYAVLEATV